MKTFTGVHLYSNINPKPWYETDDSFSSEFTKHEPYNFIHKFKDNSKILYEIDENGFRKSYSLDSNLWFFGSSIVFGETINYENIFSYIVSEKLKMPFYNFGTIGIGTSVVARTLFKLREKITNKKIIVIIPPKERYELFNHRNIITYYPHHPEYLKNIPHHNVQDFLNYSLMKDIMLIKSTTDNKDIHFFTIGKDEFIGKHLPCHIINEDLIEDTGADGLHYGIKTNKNIANFILNSIQ